VNLIVLMCDTFRRDHLGCYGNTDIRTPRLDALAAESVLFEGAYSGSFPTLPCRAEMFTGRFVFPYLEWGPLPAGDPTVAECLARRGYTCTLVTDNAQLCKPGYHYDRGFHNRIWIRGQEGDRWDPTGREVPFPCAPEKLKRAERLQDYLRGTSLRRSEEDYFAPQVFRAAAEWLEHHSRRGPFFLWVDCFDPHEPWDPPAADVAAYDPGYAGEEIISPAYGPASRFTETELRHIRALYQAEVTLVDRWLGRFLDRVDALGLREDTAVVMLSDHGILLGERGLIGKMERKTPSAARTNGWPTWPEISAVPMLWRVPGVAPGRRAGFVHPGDVAPTLLELAGAPPSPSFTTRSILPTLRAEAERVRDMAVSSWSLRHVHPRRPSVIRTDEWSMVFWRGDIEPALYHRPSDPAERTNVYAAHRGAARELHARYVAFLREQGAPLRHLWPRLALAPLSRVSGDVTDVRPERAALAVGP
jgi:arylsulfatase A-like enzyme